MHQKVDLEISDQHSVNPNCEGGGLRWSEGGGGPKCVRGEDHLMLESGMDFGQEFRGQCSDMVVGVNDFTDRAAERWSAGVVSRRGFLYGTITVGCQMDEQQKPELVIFHHSCRELLPFSVVYEHDTSSLGDSTQWGSPLPFEFMNYQCGATPPSLVVSTQKFEKAGEEVYAEGVALCSGLPECRAVAMDFQKRELQVLKGFVCRSRGTPPPTFKVGDAVRWWSKPGENPGKEVGVVAQPWSVKSEASSVEVEFPVRGLLKLEPGSLDLLSQPADLVVAVRGRERKVQCESLEPGYSCDITSRGDALELFDEATKSPEDCQKACTSAAANSSMTTGCCVLSDGICAFTRGEHFKLVVDEVGGASGAGSKYPQKRRNKLPEADEAAGRCADVPCLLDPSCAVGARSDFAPPPDVLVEAGQVTLYFDFAHPLTMPFARIRIRGSGTQIFHFTSEDAAAKTAVTDESRLVRAIGSIPQGSPALMVKKVTLLHTRGAVSRRELRRAQEALDQTCDGHSKDVGLHLAAPSLLSALTARDECLAKHSSTEAPGYEPCVVELGCKGMSAETLFLPFTGPWFSQLPFDIAAWQNPAPFCCAVPYAYEQRSELVRHKFFRTTGLRSPVSELQSVDDAKVRHSMSTSLREGSAAMRTLLAKRARDDGVVEWLSQFLINANKALAGFMREMREMVSFEGDEAEDELSENATSFLRIHEHGNMLAPSGRRAFEVARWSEEHGAFIQLGGGHLDAPVPGKSGGYLTKFWEVLKIVPGAVYTYGIKPVWNFVVGPLASWGMSIVSWVVEHPRAALFISKLALAMRERMCQKASLWAYGEDGLQAVGAFAKVSDTLGKGREYLQTTLSPATVLAGLQKLLNSDNFLQKFASLGKAAFGMTLAWAGLATGGVGAALISSLVGLFTDAALDAGKQALEMMVYQEIAKEIPSNLFDMIMNKCLFKRVAKVVTASATMQEVKDAGRQAVTVVSQELAQQAERLSESMERFTELADDAAKSPMPETMRQAAFHDVNSPF